MIISISRMIVAPLNSSLFNTYAPKEVMRKSIKLISINICNARIGILLSPIHTVRCTGAAKAWTYRSSASISPNRPSGKYQSRCFHELFCHKDILYNLARIRQLYRYGPILYKLLAVSGKYQTAASGISFQLWIWVHSPHSSFIRL